ncbi:RNA polymerase subunit sigma-70, partial [Actinomadura adrarensis]
VFDGRDAIIDMWKPVLAGPDAWGDWRSVAVWANRQPAVCNYVRRDGDVSFSPVNIDVLVVAGDRIGEITTFPPRPHLLAAFGLPAGL